MDNLCNGRNSGSQSTGQGKAAMGSRPPTDGYNHPSDGAGQRLAEECKGSDV